MPARRKIKIAPIPEPWKAAVIPLLERGRQSDVIWTIRATSNWQDVDTFGFKESAHELLIRQLRIPGLLGDDHPNMQDTLDHSLCETWAFLCPHPQGVPTQLYAKIGLHQRRVRISLISLHIDLTRDLETAIAAYLKKQKR